MTIMHGTFSKHSIPLHTSCISCGTVHTLLIDQDAFLAWCLYLPAQDAFPDLTPAQRELHFISGVCESCFELTDPPF